MLAAVLESPAAVVCFPGARGTYMTKSRTNLRFEDSLKTLVLIVTLNDQHTYYAVVSNEENRRIDVEVSGSTL